ncbi:MAG: DUF5053 domain-containing protein [Prevotella sp.]|nr:DUF5053 domain-containing protein [Prevotella sp.]
MRNLNTYIKNPTHKLIASAYAKATTPEELEAVKQYQHELQAAMTPEEKEAFDREFMEDHFRILTAMDEDINEWRSEAIRRKMGDMPKFINWTQIASTYFGKSQSWLMQRINGNQVNGKEAHFNAAEAKQLEAALHDLGQKLLSIAF